MVIVIWKCMCISLLSEPNITTSNSTLWCNSRGSIVSNRGVKHCDQSVRVEAAGSVPWVGGPPDASFGFYLREAFQSQANTEKILYDNSR